MLQNPKAPFNVSALLAEDARLEVCASALHIPLLFHCISLTAGAIVVDPNLIRGVLTDVVALLKGLMISECLKGGKR